jgi:hypothetical protein
MLENKKKQFFGRFLSQERRNPIKVTDQWKRQQEEFKFYFDPVKCGGNRWLMVQQLIFNISQKVEKKYKSEPVVDGTNEMTYLVMGSRGALMEWQEDAIIDKATQYDVNGQYSYCLVNMLIPVTAGTVTTTTKPDFKNEIGIYRVRLLGEPDPFCFRIHKDYKGNKYGFYTTYDLKMLKKMGIKYEMDNTFKDNCCIWKKSDCVEGQDIFGQIIDKLVKLKKQSDMKDDAKYIMSKLWGSLVERDSNVVPLSKIDKYDPSDISQINKEDGTFKLKQEPFIYHLGRIKPFITSYARKMMGDVIYKTKQKNYSVFKVNTDGFITDAPINVIDDIWSVGPDLGDFKIECEHENVKIVNFHKLENVK